MPVEISRRRHAGNNPEHLQIESTNHGVLGLLIMSASLHVFREEILHLMLCRACAILFNAGNIGQSRRLRCKLNYNHFLS